MNVLFCVFILCFLSFHVQIVDGIFLFDCIGNFVLKILPLLIQASQLSRFRRVLHGFCLSHGLTVGSSFLTVLQILSEFSLKHTIS